ncbi:hypothetical protein IAT38_006444 [Cryptococcus sp. DSM 104549]
MIEPDPPRPGRAIPIVHPKDKKDHARSPAHASTEQAQGPSPSNHVSDVPDVPKATNDEASPQPSNNPLTPDPPDAALAPGPVMMLSPSGRAIPLSGSEDADGDGAFGLEGRISETGAEDEGGGGGDHGAHMKIAKLEIPKYALKSVAVRRNLPDGRTLYRYLVPHLNPAQLVTWRNQLWVYHLALDPQRLPTQHVLPQDIDRPDNRSGRRLGFITWPREPDEPHTPHKWPEQLFSGQYRINFPERISRPLERVPPSKRNMEKLAWLAEQKVLARMVDTEGRERRWVKTEQVEEGLDVYWRDVPAEEVEKQKKQVVVTQVLKRDMGGEKAGDALPGADKLVLKWGTGVNGVEPIEAQEGWVPEWVTDISPSEGPCYLPTARSTPDSLKGGASNDSAGTKDQAHSDSSESGYDTPTSEVSSRAGTPEAGYMPRTRLQRLRGGAVSPEKSDESPEASEESEED